MDLKSGYHYWAVKNGLMLDQRDVCYDSTSSSTALLHYEIDTHATNLIIALAFAGNGITYSMLGATLLRAQIEKRSHPLSALFAFDRLGFQ